MIRFFDFTLSLLGVLVLLPIGIVLYINGLFDTGKPIFVQERLGKNKKPFMLIKFRTMNVDTKSEATHLSKKSSVTKYGGFLRKTKLDELPQLLNVLLGNMSLVGARPCLFSQTELILEREKRNVFHFKPGITGLGQINQVDMSTPEKLAILDAKMYHEFSLKHYFKFIFATLTGKGQGDKIGR